MPTRTMRRPRGTVRCLLVVEALEERRLLDAGPVDSRSGYPDHSAATFSEAPSREGEVRGPGNAADCGSQGGATTGNHGTPPPVASHLAGGSGGAVILRETITILITPVEGRANAGLPADRGAPTVSAPAPAAGRDRGQAVQPVNRDPAPLATVGLPPAALEVTPVAETARPDGPANPLPAAAPFIVFAGGNDGPAAVPPAGRGDLVGLLPASLPGEADAAAPEVSGPADIAAGPAFLPQTATVLTEGVAAGVAALDRAVRDFVEPLRDAGGRLAGSLYWAGGAAWFLAAALACEGARRVLRRRAGGAAASPFDPVDLLPEADL